jgi:hypothetical protein
MAENRMLQAIRRPRISWNLLRREGVCAKMPEALAAPEREKLFTFYPDQAL